jgi:hypothetical protein
LPLQIKITHAFSIEAANLSALEFALVRCNRALLSLCPYRAFYPVGYDPRIALALVSPLWFARFHQFLLPPSRSALMIEICIDEHKVLQTKLQGLDSCTPRLADCDLIS